MWMMAGYLIARLRLAVREFGPNERGAQTIEWLALGILVMAIMFGAAAAIQDNNSLGQTIIDMLGRLLGRVGADAPEG